MDDRCNTRLCSMATARAASSNSWARSMHWLLAGGCALWQPGVWLVVLLVRARKPRDDARWRRNSGSFSSAAERKRNREILLCRTLNNNRVWHIECWRVLSTAMGAARAKT